MHIVISQVPPYDGEYEFDTDIAFSTFEWRWIKQIADFKPLTIEEGLNDGDPALTCALAVIAMQRAGKISREQVLEAADVLAAAPFDGERINVKGEEVEDVDPPALTSEPEGSSQRSSLENPPPSGAILKNGSERSDETPEPTGTTRSLTSLT